MDAHMWSPDTGVWQPLIDALAPTAESMDVTRPGIAEASGVWNPVSQVVLLAGGRDVATGALSSTLWAFDPNADEGEPPFEKVTAYGDVPPGVERPVFTVDASSTAWLVGRFDDAVRVYSLDLSGYVWTLEWDEATSEGGPAGILELAGGAGPDGVDLFVVQADGAVAMWRFWTTTSTFESVPADQAETPLAGLAGWSYDRHSRTVLATATTNAGAFTLVADLETGTIETLTMAQSWPGSLAGVGMGSHPSAGTLLVGGHDPGGYTTSAWHIAEQVCD
jgi:hypothetical protein